MLTAALTCSGLGPLAFGVSRERFGAFRSVLTASLPLPLLMAVAVAVMPWHATPLVSSWAGQQSGEGEGAGANVFGLLLSRTRAGSATAVVEEDACSVRTTSDDDEGGTDDDDEAASLLAGITITGRAIAVNRRPSQ